MAEPGYWLKVRRASEHLAELDNAVVEFLLRRPYSVYVIETDDPSGRFEHRARVRDSPPDSISILAGDTVHNLRAALDHLIWALVRVAGNEPSFRTQFPIGQDEKSYRVAVKKQAGGLTAEMLNTLHGCRPWRGGNDALFDIHHLDIVDKHRLLLTAQGTVNLLTPLSATVTGERGPDGGTVFDAAQFSSQEKELSDDLFLFRSSVNNGPMLANLPLIRIRLQDAGFRPSGGVVEALTELRDTASSVINRFERFLDGDGVS
jgi:hypothetical protein